YTGNDDNIIADLLTPFSYRGRSCRIVGGLLGQWAVWTQTAVRMLSDIHRLHSDTVISAEWLTKNAALTDANAVLFDAANNFAGCIPGINEILRRQGLLPSARCLNPEERLSPGQSAEIDRILNAYPELADTEFVAANVSRWLE
ncbi:MAG: dihydrodipicolinate synthase family protein, partial [Planctomycetaceae bacterium]|nr:dihydrodipicolinate synthase family protein [Planctomycetaceae bacterium]